MKICHSKIDFKNVFHDYSFTRSIKFCWREYKFYLIKDLNSSSYLVFFTIGEYSPLKYIPLNVLTEAYHSEISVDIDKHIFDFECIKGIYEEVCDIIKEIYHETQNKLQESNV